MVTHIRSPDLIGINGLVKDAITAILLVDVRILHNLPTSYLRIVIAVSWPICYHMV